MIKLMLFKRANTYDYRTDANQFIEIVDAFGHEYQNNVSDLMKTTTMTITMMMTTLAMKTMILIF